MSQRKAKEYRQAMEQYRGVAEDVDDLKRRIAVLEVRHRREDRDKAEEIRRHQEAVKERADLERAKAMEKAEAARREERRRRNERRRRIVRRRRITAVACLAALILVMVWAIVMACAAEGTDRTATPSPVAIIGTQDTEGPTRGEDPLEAEKIEAAMLEQGYFSDAIPLTYDLQDIMRTACEEYGCPYPLALAVAEVESHFNMEAVGAAGEVGIMQLNPGPDGAYHAELEAATGLDPTTPSGNIAAGCYLLGKYMQEYGDANKAAMAYNMGVSGAENAWAEGIASTDYSTAVVEAVERWKVTVNAWNGT